MAMTFNDLSDKLQLTPVYEQEAQLKALASWCHNNISRDISYEGSDAEQYLQYFSLAVTYLDDFLTSLPQNVAQKIPEIGGVTAIQFAAENGYDQFIANHSSIPEDVLDEGDRYGMTPLHKSAIEGYTYTVKALLDKGANPKKTNAQKQYPINSVLFVPMLYEDGLIERKEMIFKDLFASAPDIVNQHDKDGNTVMHQMAAHEFDAVMSWLLSSNPELAFLKNNASLYPVHTAILNQQIAALNLLLDIDGVAALGDAEKRVPLHYAARYGTAEMVERCWQATDDINIRDVADKTPLLWAAEADNKDALEILMKHGADATLVDYQGYTILHYAVSAGNEPMVRWIVANAPKALLNQTDSEGHSPLFLAQKAGNTGIAELLK